mmetsp:Transcript_8201/g.11715  ORF Transcript_8201/g.11715 Transcript_8201/m.11715 type:complete len:105 (-) Transcript_8201:450-764(-)
MNSNNRGNNLSQKIDSSSHQKLLQAGSYQKTSPHLMGKILLVIRGYHFLCRASSTLLPRSPKLKISFNSFTESPLMLIATARQVKSSNGFISRKFAAVMSSKRI